MADPFALTPDALHNSSALPFSPSFPSSPPSRHDHELPMTTASIKHPEPPRRDAPPPPPPRPPPKRVLEPSYTLRPKYLKGLKSQNAKKHHWVHRDYMNGIHEIVCALGRVWERNEDEGFARGDNDGVENLCGGLRDGYGAEWRVYGLRSKERRRMWLHERERERAIKFSNEKEHQSGSERRKGWCTFLTEMQPEKEDDASVVYEVQSRGLKEERKRDGKQIKCSHAHGHLRPVVQKEEEEGESWSMGGVSRATSVDCCLRTKVVESGSRAPTPSQEEMASSLDGESVSDSKSEGTSQSGTLSTFGPSELHMHPGVEEDVNVSRTAKFKGFFKRRLAWKGKNQVDISDGRPGMKGKKAKSNDDSAQDFEHEHTYPPEEAPSLPSLFKEPVEPFAPRRDSVLPHPDARQTSVDLSLRHTIPTPLPYPLPFSTQPTEEEIHTSKPLMKPPSITGPSTFDSLVNPYLLRTPSCERIRSDCEQKLQRIDAKAATDAEREIARIRRDRANGSLARTATVKKAKGEAKVVRITRPTPPPTPQEVQRSGSITKRHSDHDFSLSAMQQGIKKQPGDKGQRLTPVIVPPLFPPRKRTSKHNANNVPLSIIQQKVREQLGEEGRRSTLVKKPALVNMPWEAVWHKQRRPDSPPFPPHSPPSSLEQERIPSQTYTLTYATRLISLANPTATKTPPPIATVPMRRSSLTHQGADISRCPPAGRHRGMSSAVDRQFGNTNINPDSRTETLSPENFGDWVTAPLDLTPFPPSPRQIEPKLQPQPQTFKDMSKVGNLSNSSKKKSPPTTQRNTYASSPNTSTPSQSILSKKSVKLTKHVTFGTNSTIIAHSNTWSSPTPDTADNHTDSETSLPTGQAEWSDEEYLTSNDE